MLVLQGAGSSTIGLTLQYIKAMLYIVLLGTNAQAVLCVKAHVYLVRARTVVQAHALLIVEAVCAVDSGCYFRGRMDHMAHEENAKVDPFIG